MKTMTRSRFPGALAGAAVLLSAALILPSFLLPESAQAAPLSDDDQRVFLMLVENAPGTVDDVMKRLVETLDGSGWEAVAEYVPAVDAEKCEFPARGLILQSPEFNEVLLEAGLRGAFAVPLRVVVFEDELGVHVGAQNPMSLNRTIVAEEGMAETWAGMAASLREWAGRAFPEAAAVLEHPQYGQKRDKGRIGRTMGIMAGGPFDSKITEVTRLSATEVPEIGLLAEEIRAGLAQVPGDWEWQLEGLFSIDLSHAGYAVVGVSGGPMEAKSFDIVGKGASGWRDDLACPGVDHAAAYPVEVVLAREGEEIGIYVVNEMFRMKMFFEDAGKMAFAKNMGMPGSIEDELKDKVRALLH